MKKEKIYSFTGLKCIAMMLLFWWHSTIPNPSIDLGARTCEFLFLCSGFLVAYNYLDVEFPSTWKQSVIYATKKISSFWPLHFLTFLVLFFFVSAKPLFTKENILTGFMNVTLIQSWSPDVNVYSAFNGASWFLSSLIFCYFMSPLFIGILRNVKKPIVWFAMAGTLRSVIEIVEVMAPGQFWTMNIHIHPFVRCIEFFIGMTCYMAYKKIREKNISRMTCTLCETMALGLIVVISIVFNNHLIRAIFILCMCPVILVFAVGKGVVSKMLSNKVMIKFSEIQFEFFIIHQAMIKIFAKYVLMENIIFYNIACFGAILVCSYLYHKYIGYKLKNVMMCVFEKFFTFI